MRNNEELDRDAAVHAAYGTRTITDDEKMRSGARCIICGVQAQFVGLRAIEKDCEAWRLDCPNGHTMLVDYTAEIDAADARENGMRYAENDECECVGTVHPGVSGVLLMNTSSEIDENVERCDVCQEWATDEEAAEILRKKGWQIVRQDLEDGDGEDLTYFIVVSKPDAAVDLQLGS